MMQDVLRWTVIVDPADTTVTAACRMRDANATSCVVVDGADIVGTVSERDVIEKLVAQNRLPGEVLVRDVMTAISRMSNEQVRGRIVDLLGTPASSLEDLEGVYELALTGAPIDISLVPGIE